MTEHPERWLQVSEIFGPVHQGEGPDAGQLAVFLRMAGCNLNCVWCDTPYSWDWERFNPVDERHTMYDWGLAAQVRSKLKADPRALPGLVITGGEPMLQQSKLAPLVEEWRPDARWVAVETNGTLEPKPDLAEHVDHWVVSPKLRHANTTANAIRPDVLATFVVVASGRRVTLKAVVRTVDDLPQVERLRQLMGLPHRDVWVMPEGTDPVTVVGRGGQLEPDVLERGWNLSLRQQVLLHGDARGV